MSLKIERTGCSTMAERKNKISTCQKSGRGGGGANARHSSQMSECAE